jgi:ubiquinone/menaquinone biosynthesis C-methylase UbiE
MIPFNKLGWAFHHFGPLIYPEKIRQSLCKALGSLRPAAKVLDIGAGTGILCRFASECNSALELHAIDPAEGMLKYCDSKIRAYTGVAEALPFENAAFDAVMIGEAWHHFDDIERALSEIKRVLKKEGCIFIYDFDPSTLMGKLIAKAEVLLGEPGHFYKPEALAKLLTSYGFEVKTQRYGFRYTIQGIQKDNVS